MELEVLHIDDCPNTEKALEVIEAALAALNRTDLRVRLRTITSAAEASATPFAGSPTISVDGVDLFPGAPTSDLACRVYPTPRGLSGTPTLEQCLEALKRHGL